MTIGLQNIKNCLKISALIFLSLLLSNCSGGGESLESNKEIGRNEVVDSIRNEIEYQFSLGNIEKSKQLLEISYILSKKDNYKQGILHYKKMSALYMVDVQKIGVAIKELQSISKDKNASDAMVSDVSFDLGNIFSQYVDRETGFRYFIKSVRYAEQSNDQEKIRNSFYNTGQALFAFSHFEDAKIYISKALMAYRLDKDSVNNYAKRVKLNSLLAGCYIQESKMDSAKFYLDRASENLENAPVPISKGMKISQIERAIKNLKIQNTALQGFQNLQKAIYFSKLNKTSEALRLLNENVKAENISFDNRNNVFESYKNLVSIYLGIDSLKRCELVFSKIEILKKTFNFSDFNGELLKLKSDYYSKKGDEKLAYQYLSEYLKIGKSGGSNKTTLIYDGAAVNSELIEKGDEIRQLFLEKEKEQERMRNLYIVAVLAIIIVLVVIFWLILYMRSNKRLRILNKRIIKQKKELEQFQREMENTNQELEILNKEKTHILGVVAHDLRSPIDGIEGIVYLLKHENFYKNANGKKMVDYMQQLCERGRKTITDLIDVAQMSGEEEILLETKDLNSILNDSVFHLDKVAEGKGISLKTNIPEEKIYAKINDPKISRVLDNLLTNAIKFTNKGGEISLSLEATPNKAIITVADNGIGMDEDMQKIIFNRFTKAGRQGTRGEKSLGLGMSIVKGIVDKHHGHISIESHVDQGTKVIVELDRV